MSIATIIQDTVLSFSTRHLQGSIAHIQNPRHSPALLLVGSTGLLKGACAVGFGGAEGGPGCWT
jgi:hypothetical protein